MLRLDSLYFQENNQSVRFTTLRWYIHDVMLVAKDGRIVDAPKKHFLMDAAVVDSRAVVFSNVSGMDVAEIRFKMGVDSVTQMRGALGDDLDPAEGMYWSWQSGYIHAKIEGTSSLSLAPGNEFVYHLGGYRNPNNSIISVHIPVNHHSKLLIIQMEMDKFTESAGIFELSQIMSPSRHGVALMKQFCSTIKLRDN